MIHRTTCRVCGDVLEPILSLGTQYVSDFPLTDEAQGIKAPLELVLCQKCRLLQLAHTVDPNEMYRNYWYHSGTNQTMRNALADIALKAETLMALKSGDVVLDIGCNDGTLLSSYKTAGIYKVGIDPSDVAKEAVKVADKLAVDFFSAKAYLDLVGERRAKIITSIAMFYDLEDPNRFVDDIKKVLDKNGLWIIQMSYLPLMLQTNEVGNICHEHLEYYSLYSLEFLLKRHGFEIVDVELNGINGGSLRAYIRNINANADEFGDMTYRTLSAERVLKLREQEAVLRLDEKQPYLHFAYRVERIKRDTVEFVKSRILEGKKVCVYGASTKGNTVLQYFGLDRTLISSASERNPDKWGRLTIGTNIPIVSESEARKASPDYFLVLPWHFLTEFMEREQEYLYAGGRFIVPFPYFTLI